MRPLHDAIFSILRVIPQDGTFNQPKPAEILKDYLVRRLSEGRPVWVYSIDLSAATDRLPISVQIPLISKVYSIFGFGFWQDTSRRLGELWAEILVGREFLLRWRDPPKRVKAPRRIFPSGLKVIRGNDYIPKKGELREVRVHYAVGQPMGALSS